ncbi:hypothetical protein G6M87_09300 [Rhizobium rhizogenes]|uniref:hypothetical protein n=1 Tax=Rhizobium rhizogenes TaxID=359 RepID=UPI001572FE82|nr:hypothetical protein [Rhizobium rhizogenes]NTI22057.1 hypothetical protein [Rhizobium rhizogenes]QTG05659.1 hypothetical protein G6M87_09300 [Rhizobium rhizogenes]
MECKALILMLPVALALMSTKGCQTLDARMEKAAEAQGQTQASSPPPPMPAACTAHVERVVPKVGEKFRWINQRWEVTADNRDRQADDCAAWDRDRMVGKVGNPQ